ncbi:Bacteriophage protein [Erwinia rhapontici]|uniref:phage neck terminator protein n=1 Tax=Erwinia rhapontici TaxID=55212 RepID=UPI003D360385
MSNNSSTEPGWLTPTGESPEYDAALDTLLGRWMRFVSDMPAGMVRPRWQPVHAAMPSAETNWVAFGVIEWPVDDTPAFTLQTETGSQLWRHEEFIAMASFYGPAGMRYASVFRDGISVEQNNRELNRLALSLADHGDIIPFPELINNQWVRRYDIRVRLRRKVVRTYNIQSIVDGNVTITTGE